MAVKKTKRTNKKEGKVSQKKKTIQATHRGNTAYIRVPLSEAVKILGKDADLLSVGFSLILDENDQPIGVSFTRGYRDRNGEFRTSARDVTINWDHPKISSYRDNGGDLKELAASVGADVVSRITSAYDIEFRSGFRGNVRSLDEILNSAGTRKEKKVEADDEDLPFED